MDDPAYINSILSSLVENLLECFYDEIDKIIVRLMKDVEQHHSRTFIRLIRKLSEIYEDFDLSLIEEIER
jgi:predicted nuclease of restriction endonuclease-like RecB superfamily